MTATAATTIPTVCDARDAARKASATTTHVLDAIAWTAASNAAHYVTKDWEFRLQRATELVRNIALARIVKDAEYHGFDLDDGFTYDELPEIFAAQVTLFAAAGVMDWLNRLDQMAY
ncbi:hypothetical protein ACQP1V_42930 (plasmid) [Microtetraspora malaysiensis]|uniref:hypothetical protein n=1 Tax=Microtetraspora malaysiensis TaxID=161358 RepID=UPI003D8B6FDA